VIDFYAVPTVPYHVEVTGSRRNKQISKFSCVYIFLAAPSAFSVSQKTEMSGGFPEMLLILQMLLQMPGNRQVEFQFIPSKIIEPKLFITKLIVSASTGLPPAATQSLYILNLLS
jgi:hypothetical protein